MLGWWNQEGRGEQVTCHAWDRTEMRAEFLWVKLKEAEHLEDLTQLEGYGLD